MYDGLVDWFESETIVVLDRAGDAPLQLHRPGVQPDVPPPQLCRAVRRARDPPAHADDGLQPPRWLRARVDADGLCGGSHACVKAGTAHSRYNIRSILQVPF